MIVAPTRIHIHADADHDHAGIRTFAQNAGQLAVIDQGVIRPFQIDFQAWHRVLAGESHRQTGDQGNGSRIAKKSASVMKDDAGRQHPWRCLPRVAIAAAASGLPFGPDDGAMGQGRPMLQRPGVGGWAGFQLDQPRRHGGEISVGGRKARALCPAASA